MARCNFYLVKTMDAIAHLPPITIAIASSKSALHVYDHQPKASLNNIHDSLKDIPESAQKVKRSRVFYVDKRIVASRNFSRMILVKFQNLSLGSTDEPLKIENVDALEILLREAHSARDDKLFEANLRTIWQIHTVTDFYEIDLQSLKSWFQEWYERDQLLKPWEEMGKMDQVSRARQLLYPAYWFDEAKAFGTATKRLMYKGVGHLDAVEPPDVKFNFNKRSGEIIREIWF